MASEVIKLNLIPKGEMPVFHCSQFDNGRLINIELYRGEDAYTIPEGCTAELHCRKVDGNIVTIGSPVVDENTIKFTSTTQLTACNGKNLCEVSILGADDYLIGSLNFWLEVEVDPLKGGINSTSEIHDLYEQIEDITAEVIGDDYYDKTEVDNLLSEKADTDTVYTIGEVNSLLSGKANVADVYTKSETNTLLTAKADADNVYTKAQVESKLAAKADAAAVYTKDETDTLLDAKANANAVYTKVEVDSFLDDKADKSTTYTKTQIDSALALKANAATTYTKTEVDTALALKANAADVYTKTQVDNIILDIMPVDTASGATAEFNTQIAAPLVSVIADITATGGGGTPASPIPIVGYSQAVITANGDDITISFGQTVYGGVLDVTRGKLSVTWGGVDLGDLEYTTRAFGTNSGFVSANIPNAVAVSGSTGIANAKCSALKLVTNGGMSGADNNMFALGAYWQSGANLYIVATDYATPEALKTAMSGQKLIYELATPFDIDLTPVQISALVGENNVYGDTNGDTTVKFKDTIQNYIDKKVST